MALGRAIVEAHGGTVWVEIGDRGMFKSCWQPEWAGCLLADIRMSGIDGLSLQKKLNQLDCLIPVIIISGHGDVSMAREAFKANALDFLEKPLDDVRQIAAIDEALSHEEKNRDGAQRRAHSNDLLGQLTPREREVMQLVVLGRHNRDIAPKLSISVRTVEVHKARLMSKLGVDNAADLVSISMQEDGS